MRYRVRIVKRMMYLKRSEQSISDKCVRFLYSQIGDDLNE